MGLLEELPQKPIDDEARREVFWQDCRLDLSPTELAVLSYLDSRAGQVVSYDELLQAVWNTSLAQGGSLDQVRNTVKRLRRKLKASSDHPCHLVNVRGVGYRLDLLAEAHKARPFRFPLLSKPASIVGLLTIVGLTFAIAWLLWGQFPSGDPRTPAWYRGRRVPIGLLHLVGRGDFCAGIGGVYCFDRKEEMAAAMGEAFPGVDGEVLDELRDTGAVPLL